MLEMNDQNFTKFNLKSFSVRHHDFFKEFEWTHDPILIYWDMGLFSFEISITAQYHMKIVIFLNYFVFYLKFKI